MKKLSFQNLIPIVLVWLVLAPDLGAQTIPATIDAAKIGRPISPLIYGQFIEHIGGLIENGLWAEMLDDRKFYHPVTPEAPAPTPQRGRGRPPRRWLPIGPPDAVTMDAATAYAGDHAPRVQVDGAEPRGIVQAGLAVRAGKRYSGRVVLVADPGVLVGATLVWGAGAADRQRVEFRAQKSGNATVPLAFTAAASADDARLEITGTGTGSFHVGAVSLMPADNVEGFRREVIAALAELRSGVYRFPGGNFVSAYEWRDAIGDRDRRPPRWDPVWNALQPNDVGMDEFLTLCRLLSVEPYITVNAGFGDAWSAAQQVEYANGAATTPMGRLRAANGHPEPYSVKYWGIGNEMWGSWQFGYMPLDQFVVKHNMFARAMRRVDPTIKLIASGATPDAMTGSGEAKKLTGKVVAAYGSPADWSGAMLSRCLEYMDLLSEHYYVYNGTHFDLEKGAQVPVDPGEPLADWARRAANLVRAKYEHYQVYLERIPALRGRPVPISLDEWAYAGANPNSYKPVLAYSWALHEMFRHSELFQMGGFTFAGSTLSASRTDAVLNPTGLMFKMYRDHFGTLPVDVAGSSPQPAPKYPPGADQPTVNAGSDTYPLEIAAALGADRKSLSVAVVNPTETAQQLDLAIKGVEITNGGRVWRMAPPSLTATIVAGHKPPVEIEELPLGSWPATLTVPPISVSIYVLPLR
jgi:alpha-N-arabinofuranosidase